MNRPTHPKKISILHGYGIGDYVLYNGVVCKYMKDLPQGTKFSIGYNKVEYLKSINCLYPSLTLLRIDNTQMTKSLSRVRRERSENESIRTSRKRESGFGRQTHIVKRNREKIISKEYKGYDQLISSAFQFHFHLERNYERENSLYQKLISVIGDKYIVIHSRSKDNANRDMLQLNTSIINNPNDLPMFNIDINDTERNFSIISDNFFDYCTILENAQQIHCYEGSVCNLTDRLLSTQSVPKFCHLYCKYKPLDFLCTIKKLIKSNKWHLQEWTYYECATNQINKFINKNLLINIPKRLQNIRLKSHFLFDEISHSLNAQQKLQKYKHCFRGKKAIVLTCGPSLEKYKDQLTTINWDKFILVCVKDSINRVGKELKMLCDIHIYNDARHIGNESYMYNPQCKPIVVTGNIDIDKADIYAIPKLADKKLKYIDNKRKAAQDRTQFNILTQLLKDIDIMSFEKNVSKDGKQLSFYWGDIMYELVIPMLIHTGIENAYVIGWDFNYKRSTESKTKNLRNQYDELQRVASEKAHSFLKNKFNLDLRLIGDTSILKIPSINFNEIK